MQVWEIRVQFPAEAGIFYMPNQPLLYLDTASFSFKNFLKAVKLVTLI
jgi:hypothetical protein